MRWLLEKTTSAYAILTSFVLMGGSVLGAFMTLLEDHIIVLSPTPSTPFKPSATPSSAKTLSSADESLLTPSSSTANPPACGNQGESMQIIAFLLFGCKFSLLLFYRFISISFLLYNVTVQIIYSRTFFFFFYLPVYFLSLFMVSSNIFHRLPPCIFLFCSHDNGWVLSSMLYGKYWLTFRILD